MAIIPGTPQADTLDGTDFADEITGLAGDDLIFGHDGDDTITAGAGDDEVFGESGNDTVYGGKGRDTLNGDQGEDRLYGGADDDVIHLSADENPAGSRGWGGAGDDLFTVLDAADVWAYGGDGTDAAVLFWLDSPITGPGAGARVDFSAANPIAVSSTGNIARFTSVERLVMFTGAGADTITGGAFDDFIDADLGQNVVDAGDGNDTVTYQNGVANILAGGLGDDRLQVFAGTSPLYFIVDLFDGDVDDGSLSTISGFERYVAFGDDLNDIIGLGNGNDIALGERGNDTIFGAAGDDTLYGDHDDDLIGGGDDADILYAGSGNDTVTGDAGADVVIGKQGQDSLDGGTGNDRMVGGRGTDTLTGGEGADVFIFGAAEDGFDLITDFVSGVDRIRYFAANLPSAPAPGPVDPLIFSYDNLNGSAPQFILRFHADVNETWLHWDNDGPSAGDYGLIRFAGDVNVVAADILLI